MVQRTKRFPPSGVNTRGGGGLCSTCAGCTGCFVDGVSTTTATGGGDSFFGRGGGEAEGVGGAVCSSSFLVGSGDGETSSRAGIGMLSGDAPIKISGTCFDSFLSSLGHALQSS